MTDERDVADHSGETTATPKVDVEEVSDDITHVLGHSWFFDPQTIKVAISNGRVKLTGTVRTAQERRMAAAAAWAVEGVTDVENDIVVV